MIKKNKVIVISVVIILIILLISSFSYAWIIYNMIQEDEHIGSSDCFKLTLTSLNNISLSDAYPLSEVEAQNLVPYTFTIKNICNQASSYDITLEELNDSTMDLNAIRYKLNNEESNILGSVTSNNSSVLNNSNSSKTIKSGILLKNEEVSYSLKLWIDENSSVEQAAGKIFSSKIVIVSNMDKYPYYIITLNKNNNESNEGVNIVKGRDISTISNPTKSGYTFEGWYSDISLENKITSSYIPSDNMDIYAKYVPNSYEVTLDESNTSVNVIFDGELASITPPTKAGYTFEGYYSDSGGKGSKYYNSSGSSIKNYDIAGDATLYANWTPVTYTISYNLNGGSVSSANKTSYTINDSNFVLNKPTRSGYVFAGWTGTDLSERTLNTTIRTSSIKNMSFTANWKQQVSVNKVAASAVYTANDKALLVFQGTGHLDFLLTYMGNPACYKMALWNTTNGQDDLVWYTAAYSAAATLNAGGTGVNTGSGTYRGFTYNRYYWTQTKHSNVNGSLALHTYDCANNFISAFGFNLWNTLTYNGNGGTSSSASYRLNNGDANLGVTSTRSGYTFLGWSEGTNGNILTGLQMGSSDVTIYAQWAKTSN